MILITPSLSQIDRSKFTEHQVSALLRFLGVDPSKKGFEYIKRGIMMIQSNPEYKTSTMKLYNALASEYNEDYKRVERDIRGSIDTVFEYGNMELIDIIFGYTQSYSKGKVVNSQFLATLVEELQYMTDDGKLTLVNITYDCDRDRIVKRLNSR